MFEIRPASESDAQTLTDLATSTFIETFAKDNRKEDMDQYIAETFTLDNQLSEIRDPNRLVAIAWSNGKAAGFVHLLKGKPDAAVQGPKPIELLRLYVDSQWHGKGVGAALMEHCLQTACKKGFGTLWLGVWEKNFRAQAFYQKYDFKIVGSHIFRLGSDDQTDLVMERKI